MKFKDNPLVKDKLPTLLFQKVLNLKFSGPFQNSTNGYFLKEIILEKRNQYSIKTAFKCSGERVHYLVFKDLSKRVKTQVEPGVKLVGIL